MTAPGRLYVLRIVAIFRRRGLCLDPLRAEAAWEEYSAGYAAGWMVLPDEDDDVFEIVSDQINNMTGEHRG